MLWHSLHSLCIKLLFWVIFAIKTLVVTRFWAPAFVFPPHRITPPKRVARIWGKAAPNVSVSSEILNNVTQLRYFSLILHKFYGYFSTKLCLEPFGISEIMFTLGTTLDGTVLWNYKGYKKWCSVMTSLNTGKNYVAK